MLKTPGFLCPSIFLFLLSLMGGGRVEAGTLTFGWDRPVMADGTEIPCESHILYKVHWGPTPRTSPTYAYPNRSGRTNLRRLTVTAPSGTTRCFTVNAYVAKAHTWTVEGVTYSLTAGEGPYGAERCLRVP